MKGFIKEFREFAMRGNVLDLAVGIIIGAAFTAIVKALVDHILTPLLGILMGGVKVGHLKWVLTYNEANEPLISMNYGLFIQAIINFILVAFSIFCLVKFIKSLERKKEAEQAAAPAAPPKSEVLLEEIRDLLKEQK